MIKLASQIKLLPFLFFLCLISCIEKNAKTANVTEQEVEFDKSILGEDLDEIHCYVKKIYKKEGYILVDIDLIQVTMTPEGERFIKNENPKLRTYLVNESTLIYLHDCESTNPEKLTEIKQAVLDDKTVVVVGNSKDGVLKSINFGCYG